MKVLTKRERLYSNNKWQGKQYHSYGSFFVPKQYEEHYKLIGNFIDPILDVHELLTR